MNTFPFPAEPTEKQVALQDAIVRWITILLPLAIVGHLLGALALVAVLISANFNILGWIE